MEKNKIAFICLLLCFGCVPRERSNNVIEPKIEQIPIIITKTDTFFVTVEVPLTINQKYEVALRKYIGTRELTGKNDGAAIVEILRNCGINIPAPWCACYLNQGLIDIGLHGPVKQPAYTPRWFEDPKRIVWNRQTSDVKQSFEKGWIGGIYFRNLGRIGHVAAIVEDFEDGYVLTIEGNTNAEGGREGNGVYLRIRHKSEFYIIADWLHEV